MTALTIDIDDPQIEALRDAAARRHATVDAIVGKRMSGIMTQDDSEGGARVLARGTLGDLISKSAVLMSPGFVWSRRVHRQSDRFHLASATHRLGCALTSFILLFCFSVDTAKASDVADLMNTFKRLCIDNALKYSAISGSAATDHLPSIDQRTMSAGSVSLRTSIWLLRKEPPAALIVVDESDTGKVSMCGISDHTTPLADMANELAFRIRTKQLKTRGMGVNDVSLDDNGGTVHIVSDPGGTSASGFFLFRAAP